MLLFESHLPRETPKNSKVHHVCTLECCCYWCSHGHIGGWGCPRILEMAPEVPVQVSVTFMLFTIDMFFSRICGTAYFPKESQTEGCLCVPSASLFFAFARLCITWGYTSAFSLQTGQYIDFTPYGTTQCSLSTLRLVLYGVLKVWHEVKLIKDSGLMYYREHGHFRSSNSIGYFGILFVVLFEITCSMVFLVDTVLWGILFPWAKSTGSNLNVFLNFWSYNHHAANFLFMAVEFIFAMVRFHSSLYLIFISSNPSLLQIFCSCLCGR